MKRVYDDDDGRTIVDMNVPGMPGYVDKNERAKHHGQLDRSESRMVMGAVLKWLLVFWAVVSGSMILVVFLLTRLWS